MKLTDFLSDVGRPIAYYPSLRKITGSTTATILLCQFIYWRGKESDPNGWLYKTSDEIEEETGLSYNEQKTARANLVSAELIEEYYARLDHQMKFRVNLDMINLLWGTEQTVIPESDNPSFGKATIHDSLNESEITTENKHKPDMLDMLLEQEQKSQPIRNACLDFENALLGSTVSQWPWDSNSKWQKFAKWVAAQDSALFVQYAEWRKADGKFHALSNNKIRQDPQMFMDTGWPTFLAHVSMYKPKDKGFAL